MTTWKFIKPIYIKSMHVHTYITMIKGEHSVGMFDMASTSMGQKRWRMQKGAGSIIFMFRIEINKKEMTSSLAY